MPQALGASLAVPAAFVLLLVPGLTFLALLQDGERRRLHLDERVFFTIAISVAASSWLALTLAEFGVFSTARAAAIEAAICVVSMLVCAARGRRPHWPLFREASPASLAPALLVAIVAFSLHARPSEYIVGGRDPGAYVSAMGVIARTGAITHRDSVVVSIPQDDLSLFYANLDEPPFRFTLDVDDDRPQPSWPRFMGFELDHPKSGYVTPQFFHLFPAFGAYLFETMGVRGALATPPIFGVLGTLATFFLGRRMFGTAAGLIGSLALASSVLQVWFARYPVSEGFSQFLILTGLLAHRLDDEADGRGFGWLAGSLLGLTLLVRIENVLLVLPLAIWFGLMIFGRTRKDWAARVVSIAVPFTLVAAHAALHALLFSTRYTHQILTRKYWNHPPELWAGLFIVAVVIAALLWRAGPSVIARVAADQSRIRAATIALLAGLALYAVAVRPTLSAWAGGDGNPKAEKLADPSLLRALGFNRLAAHDAQALNRYSWFVGAPLLALALAGLSLLVKRVDAAGILALLVFLAFSVFYFYKIRVFNDYFFAMRRYVPVTLPFTFLLAAWALVVLEREIPRGRVLATALGVASIIPSLVNTWPILTYSDWKGSVRFVADVARRFGPKDVVLFEQPKNIHLLSLPLWGLYGTNALEFRRFNPDPAKLRHLIGSWSDIYRNVYLITSYRTDVCGLFLERAQTFRFTSAEFEWTYDRVPSKAEPRAVEFSLSRVVEPEKLRVSTEPLLDIGGSGDSQTSGFFEAEATGEKTYRWTGGCLDDQGNATGSIYVPAAANGASLRIRATAHARPATARPAEVGAYFNGVAVGHFLADNTWRDFEVILPDPLPAGPKILRLDVPAWRPSNTDPRSTDTRDLGIMVDSVEVLPRSPKR